MDHLASSIPFILLVIYLFNLNNASFHKVLTSSFYLKMYYAFGKEARVFCPFKEQVAAYVTDMQSSILI